MILHSYEELDTYLGEKVLLVCDSSIKFLKINDYFNGKENIIRFSDFVPNPLYESVVKGVDLFHKENCDTIVAVGGGSAMDVAKCIKLYSNMYREENYLKQKMVPNDVPLVAVPTTAGTGSEATRYAIPTVFIIGWRGEPGLHDEPQHIYQGEVTVKLLDDMDIKSFVIGKETTDEEVEKAMEEFRALLAKGKDVAFVIRKGALSTDVKVEYKNNNKMVREEIIQHIVKATGEDPIVSTTGKASRELFETRVANNQSHKYDFLTVGSMGHASSIALGVAINKPEQKIWCVDGDGAVLMHMGAMAVLGANAPKNMVHVVINNGAHETVGGMPTVASNIDLVGVAKACGYPYSVSVDSFEALDKELADAKNRNELSLIEVKCSIGARDDLGRPTTTALENKVNFMEYLKTI